jgi:hypothetical protein
MLALFDGSSAEGSIRAVTFTAGNEELKVFINLVQREDGSGESWIFEGSLVHGEAYQPIRVYFSTKRREGYLRCTV